MLSATMCMHELRSIWKIGSTAGCVLFSTRFAVHAHHMVPSICHSLLLLERCWLHLNPLPMQAAYQEVQAFAKYGGAGTKSMAAFNTRGSSGEVLCCVALKC